MRSIIFAILVSLFPCAINANAKEGSSEALADQLFECAGYENFWVVDSNKPEDEINPKRFFDAAIALSSREHVESRAQAISSALTSDVIDGAYARHKRGESNDDYFNAKVLACRKMLQAYDDGRSVPAQRD